MTRNETKPASRCALCGEKRKLERSHIIPRFVYRWAECTSGNHGQPDGPRHPMLCRPCEDRFSFNESEFAREVFHPYADRSLLSARYASWLRQFSASVCWRILEWNLTEAPLASRPERWVQALASCRETWRLYLSGKRPDVGEHHLHLLPSNVVSGESGAGLRTIGMSINFTDEAAFVYAKLGPIVLVGLIADHAPALWQGTRVNAEGILKPRDRAVPDYFRTFIFSQRTSSG